MAAKLDEIQEILCTGFQLTQSPCYCMDFDTAGSCCSRASGTASATTAVAVRYVDRGEVGGRRSRGGGGGGGGGGEEEERRRRRRRRKRQEEEKAGGGGSETASANEEEAARLPTRREGGGGRREENCQEWCTATGRRNRRCYFVMALRHCHWNINPSNTNLKQRISIVFHCSATECNAMQRRSRTNLTTEIGFNDTDGLDFGTVAA